MTDVNSVSFEEQLKSKKQIFTLTLDNYRHCYTEYITSQNNETLEKCNNYEKKLNDITDHDLLLLQKSITSKLQKMNKSLNSSAKDIDKLKKVSSNNKSDFNLASEPYKNELYTVKIWKFINLAYYLCGIMGLMYFIKEQGATFIIKLAQQ